MFQNSSNPSQADFQETSGVMEWADRTRTEFPRYENLGFTYDAGTGIFTIRGSEADLSVDNPAYVTIFLEGQPTEYRRFRITSNSTFQDSNGTSTLINNLFGLTTGVAHANFMPFYIYAVVNDTNTNVEFAISRFPNTRSSSSIANSGSPASATADMETSFFYLNSVTLGDYDLNNCVVLGGFRMTKNASDDWTVSTLATIDGFGKFFNGQVFQMSAGQFGAASGKFFADNGGTAPAFADNEPYYRISVFDNSIRLFYAFNNCTTAGVGAVVATLALPYTITTPNLISTIIGTGRRVDSGGTTLALLPVAIAGNNSLIFRELNNVVNTVVLNTNFVVSANVQFTVSGSFPL